MQIFDKITDKIRHIQSQPESVKARYIWTLTISVFIVIITVWMIFSKINRPNIGSGADTPILNVQNDIKEKIKSGYGELKNNALPEFKELLKDKEKTDETQITPSPSQGVNK